MVQIETPRPLTRLCGGPSADREEKRVTRGSDTSEAKPIRSSLTSITPIREALSGDGGALASRSTGLTATRLDLERSRSG